MLLLNLFLIVVCCFIIWRTSDGFEIASNYLGRNLTDGVRGATINAIGSSLPELFTSFFFIFVLDILSNDADEGFGGGIGTTAGSAVFNAMVIPAAVIFVMYLLNLNRFVGVSRKVIIRDGLMLLLAEYVLVITISGTEINFFNGLILVSIYIGYLIILFVTMNKKTPKKKHEAEIENAEDSDFILPRKVSLLKSFLVLKLDDLILQGGQINKRNGWLLLAISTVIMALACIILVLSCEIIGNSMGIPVLFVAVILAAAASSVPDTLISIRDAKNGKLDDSISNVLGSNIFDICFCLGFPLMLYTLINGNINISSSSDDISELRVLLLLLTLCSFLIFLVGKKLSRIKGVMLLGLYVLFTMYVIGRSYDNQIAVDFGVQLQQLVELISFR